MNEVRHLCKECVRSFVMVLLVLTFFSPVTLKAQANCINNAEGVPALSGPPIWWDKNTNNPFPNRPYEDDRLTDPRWRDAFAITYPGMGTSSEELSFRALYKEESGVTYLYLSWYIKIAPSFDTPNNNNVYVGFSPGGNAQDVLIKITLQNVNKAIAAAQPTYAPEIWVRPPGDSWAPQNTVPAWVSDFTRVWIIPATTPGENHQWAVQMRVPLTDTTNINNGINIDPTAAFNMWYEVRTDTPDSVGGLGFIQYNWPRSASTTFSNFKEEYPATTVWGEFRLRTDPADPHCAANCVSLAYLDIGTTNSPSSKISLDQDNIFYARPYNNTGDAIPAGGIKADFRIANWGSLADWNDVPATSTLWELIPDGTDADSNPDGENVTNIGPIPNSTKADASSNLIQFKWAPKQADKDLFINGKKRLHQCMYVELKGSGMVFCNKSVYRNMDFVKASKFTRVADLSVVGLPSLTSSLKRDVYLYLEKQNMPEFITPRQKRSGYVTGKDNLESIDINNTIATYVVHVYHDTGQRYTINGKQNIVLRPQSPFGYFINHEGGLEGWKDSLTGDNLIKIAPNWYKIAVPNNGVATVTTTIKAINPKFAVSARLGMDLPHGIFNNMVNPGLSLNVGLEYLLSSYFSLEAIFGYHKFADGGLGKDQDIFQFSGNLRYFFPVSSRFRTFINSGAGIYKLDPGNTKSGFNFGTGLDFYLTTQFALEAAYNYHTVNTTGANLNFSTVQGGLRYRF